MYHKHPPEQMADAAGHDGAQHRFSLRFEATELDVRRAMLLLAGLLASLGIGRADAEKTELVLAEALNNVVEHAMAAKKKSDIHLEVRFSSAELTCRIRDKGNPMPTGRPPPGGIDIKNVPRAELPEGGFGWMLIKRVTQKLTFQRRGDENQLELVIPLAIPHSSTPSGVKPDRISQPVRRAPAP